MQAYLATAISKDSDQTGHCCHFPAFDQNVPAAD